MLMMQVVPPARALHSVYSHRHFSHECDDNDGSGDDDDADHDDNDADGNNDRGDMFFSFQVVNCGHNLYSPEGETTSAIVQVQS